MKHRDTLFWKNPQIAIIVFLLFCTINTAPAQNTMPAEDIAEKALAATVYLEMKDTNGKTLGIGSGFFVKPNLIATNYHVIAGATKGTAKLVGKSTTYKIEGVTATDKQNDLALLKVTAYGIKPLSLGDSDKIRIGETVYVAGNPKGLEGTFSDGIISSKRSEDTKERLQMTAPISPGSSGGPVLSKKGEVIGVSFMTLEIGQNLNFAIPSKYLKKLLEQSKLAKPLSPEKQSISAETYFLWGNAKYHLGDYVGAIKDYTAAIRLKPDYPSAYNNRAIAKDDLGQHFAAIADYDIAIRLKPDYAKAYYNRGNTKDDLGQYAAAIADYDITIRLKPDHPSAYYNRGNAKSALGQYFAAISDYDIAIRLEPDDADAYLNRGVAKAKLGRHLAAISDYDTAIRLEPDDADAYLNRGVAKADLEQYFAAIADYDIAIRLKPDYALAYDNRGVAKADLEQYFAAIADHDIAIRLKPDDARAYYNRAYAKTHLEQYSAAIADYDFAIRFKPDYAKAYNSRGLAKNRLEQYSAAISDYDFAIRLKPDYAKAYLNRGLAEFRLGRTLAAKQDFRTALRLAIKAGDVDTKNKAEEALRLLNELNK